MKIGATGLLTGFLSTSPLRGTTVLDICAVLGINISIHVPLAGDDIHNARKGPINDNFYPRPPCGGRLCVKWLFAALKNFYPRPPCGGRPALRSDGRRQKVFLSTSPLRGTTKLQEYEYYWNKISIHVPLAGDDSLTLVWRSCRIISIHVPLAGDDDWLLRYQDCLRTISIHVPLAGDDVVVPQNVKAAKRISIHVPLRGTTSGLRVPRQSCAFLSTSPLRGTTAAVHHGRGSANISIHVPLAGDDPASTKTGASRKNFYPRPPCGGRPVSSGAGDHGVENFYPRPPCGGRPRHKRACTETWRFLSTSPLRGTTHRGITGGAVAAISIHVPLAGDDRWKPRRPSPAAYFYPRPPCGGRLRRRYILGQKWEFLSTSPLRGTTCDIFGGKYKIIHISIHVPLAL